MITRNSYIEWYKKEKQEMIKSGKYDEEPGFLFKYIIGDWIFNPNNWHGGDVLRWFLSEQVDKTNNVGPFEIKRYNHNDQNTIFLFTSKDWYELSWYKNRGKTDSIKMNGKPIYIDDYIKLCNLLGVSLK